MIIEGQYLTFAEYQQLGGTLDLTPFNLLEYEERRKIDANTQNRLVNETDIPQEVKLCMFKLVNTLEQYTNETNRTIASESVGSYSVNYKDNIEQIIKGKNKELEDLIYDYLYGVVVNDEHVLYLGVD